MAIKARVALFFTIITTVCFLLAMVTPWWYTHFKNSSHRALCFIDGTCHYTDFVFKNNGDAQSVFDATMIMMIVAWVPWLIFIHFFFFRYNKSYRQPGRRFWLFMSGLTTWFLLLASVVVFSTGLTWGFHLDEQFYGNINVFTTSSSAITNPWAQNFHWGPHFGWYVAVACLIMMMPSILFAISMRGATKKTVAMKDGRIVVETTSRPTYQTMATPQSVASL